MIFCCTKFFVFLKTGIFHFSSEEEKFAMSPGEEKTLLGLLKKPLKGCGPIRFCSDSRCPGLSSALEPLLSAVFYGRGPKSWTKLEMEGDTLGEWT
jgi:hypothetical protein